jgi:hypothetical protein
MMLRPGLLALLSLTILAHGQDPLPRRIPASDVERASHELLGDSTAWPVLVAAAERDVEVNAFVLSRAALAGLRTFRDNHRSILKARTDVRRLIGRGARVFAPAELDSVNRLLDDYANAVRQGNAGLALALHAPLLEKAAALETEVARQRTEDVMAALASKSGSVDKRKGLLGRWEGSFLKDLFGPTDAVRTGDKSQAGLTFSDGVDVLVGERTTVVIRESRMDRLDRRVQRDVDVVNGTVLAQMTAAARESGSLTLRAGPAASDVRSGRFWVEAAQRREMRLSNYDGSIQVAANNVEVRLEKNQGTVARAGQAPMKPVNLLEPPALAYSSPDTVIGSDAFQLEWRPVQGAVSYLIETSLDRNVSGEVRRQPVTQRRTLLTGLPLGPTYVRLAAIDANGLRGMESRVYGIVRVDDRQPPAILLETGEAAALVTSRTRYDVRGITEPGARLTVNGKTVQISEDGSFVAPVDVAPPFVAIRLQVADRAGNIASRSIVVLPPDIRRLRDIRWNAPISGARVSLASRRLDLTGQAYADMRITFTNGTITRSVQTSPEGRWAISLDDPPVGAWTLSMELMKEGAVVLKDDYELR